MQCNCNQCACEPALRVEPLVEVGNPEGWKRPMLQTQGIGEFFWLWVWCMDYCKKHDNSEANCDQQASLNTCKWWAW